MAYNMRWDVMSIFVIKLKIIKLYKQANERLNYQKKVFYVQKQATNSLKSNTFHL